jgi:hypothetical protein
MADYLSNLAKRSLVPEQEIQPRLASRFESPPMPGRPAFSPRMAGSLFDENEASEGIGTEAVGETPRAPHRAPPRPLAPPPAATHTGQVVPSGHSLPVARREDTPQEVVPRRPSPTSPRPAPSVAVTAHIQASTGQSHQSALPARLQSTPLVEPEIVSRATEDNQQEPPRSHAPRSLPTPQPTISPRPDSSDLSHPDPERPAIQRARPAASLPLEPAPPRRHKLQGPSGRDLLTSQPANPQSAPAPTTIQVTIGRIEIRAAPSPRNAPEAPPKGRPAANVTDLEAYLRRRNGGER